MSNLKEKNNQIRAAQGAIALEAYNKARGEVNEGSDDDINDLILSLLHLKYLTPKCEESIEDNIEFLGNVAIKEIEDDEQSGVELEWPEGGKAALELWIGNRVIKED